MNTIPNPHIRFSYEDTAHQQISRNLEFLLLAHVRAQRLGTVFHAPMDVVFGAGADREVAQPDLLFVRAERRGIIGHDAVGGAPDLVVEIFSPGTEARDCGYNKPLYARFGVAEYWIVDPEVPAIEVHALGTDGYEMKGRYRKGDRFASPLFPDLVLPLDEVFNAE